MLGKILIFTLLYMADGASILSVGKIININPQQTNQATLQCEAQFTGSENSFNVIVYWYKLQDLNSLEKLDTKDIVAAKLAQSTQMSTEMENATSYTKLVSTYTNKATLFADAKFSVKADPTNNGVTVTLSISGIEPQDSGRYICAVSSDSSAIQVVNFDLNVLQAVSQVLLIGAPTVSNNQTYNSQMSSNSLYYYENRPGYFQCQSQGGYPKPSLNVYIGEERKTGSLSPATVNYTLTGTPIGRQLINPIQVINSTSFQVTRQMNDMKLRCQADVRDTNSTGNATFDSKVVEKTLIVYYEPTIECRGMEDSSRIVTIPVGQKNIQIHCDIEARPVPSKITWTAKTSSVTAISGDPTTNRLNIQASTQVEGTDLIVAQLQFQEVTEDHFQDYDIVAENEVGRTLVTLTLRNGELREGENTNKATTVSSVISLFVGVTIFQLLLCFS